VLTGLGLTGRRHRVFRLTVLPDVVEAIEQHRDPVLPDVPAPPDELLLSPGTLLPSVGASQFLLACLT